MARLSFPQRAVLILLFAAFVAVPAVLGAQPRPRSEERPAGFVAALVWELRAQWWGLLSGFWEKEGCSIDPHGGCTKSAVDKITDVVIQGDEGCGIDPHGGCAKRAVDKTTDVVIQGDEGCGLDPHGGCGH